jgi:hypothetical protein
MQARSRAAAMQTSEPPSQYSPWQRRLRRLLQCVIPFRLNNFMTRHQDHRPSGRLSAAMKYADAAASTLMGELLVEGIGAGLTIQVQGRVKSLYSTHRKMQLKKVPIEQVRPQWPGPHACASHRRPLAAACRCLGMGSACQPHASHKRHSRRESLRMRCTRYAAERTCNPQHHGCCGRITAAAEWTCSATREASQRQRAHHAVRAAQVHDAVHRCTMWCAGV